MITQTPLNRPRPNLVIQSSKFDQEFFAKQKNTMTLSVDTEQILHNMKQKEKLKLSQQNQKKEEPPDQRQSTTHMREEDDDEVVIDQNEKNVSKLSAIPEIPRAADVSKKDIRSVDNPKELVLPQIEVRNSLPVQEIDGKLSPK